MKLNVMLAGLSRKCAIGTKANSKGHHFRCGGKGQAAIDWLHVQRWLRFFESPTGCPERMIPENARFSSNQQSDGAALKVDTYF